jgi:hypothetical protein
MWDGEEEAKRHQWEESKEPYSFGVCDAHHTYGRCLALSGRSMQLARSLQASAQTAALPPLPRSRSSIGNENATHWNDSCVGFGDMIGSLPSYGASSITQCSWVTFAQPYARVGHFGAAHFKPLAAVWGALAPRRRRCSASGGNIYPPRASHPANRRRGPGYFGRKGQGRSQGRN